MSERDPESASPLHIMYDEPPAPPRDRLIVWLHRVLGFLLGGAMAFLRAIWWDGVGALRLVVVTIAAGVLTGWAAGRYGQRFWDWVFGRPVCRLPSQR